MRRKTDVVVIVGGHSATLGEFAIAYEQGKLIGVLTGTSGITSVLSSLQASLNKQTGAEVMYEPDPEALVGKLLRGICRRVTNARVIRPQPVRSP